MSRKRTEYRGVRRLGLYPCTLAACLLVAWAPGALAFDSGSTGVDGAFTPQVDTVLTLPEDGIFNFTSVNVPAGVTVTFAPNTTNTPVTWLVSGNVTIAGTVDLSGGNGVAVGASGDGNIGDDGIPGVGGPGGFSGGRGGEPAVSGERYGGAGLGPGGGGAGYFNGTALLYGGTAAFSTVGSASTYPSVGGAASRGASYGAATLLPLLGGSGGGGGAGGTAFHGSGGGGGGGAILIAASGRVEVSGSLLANGGRNGEKAGSGIGAGGAPGSGGAIRIVATTIAGEGTLSAIGGKFSENNIFYSGAGRIRLEAENFQRTAASNPVHSFGVPNALFIAGSPQVRITSVGGVAVPNPPNGVDDVALPEDQPNPVEIVFETTGIPVGNVVELSVHPAYGTVIEAVSGALLGSSDLASATTTVTLPSGPSVLTASVTYAVAGQVAADLGRYTGGEQVARVRLSAPLGGEAQAVLITSSGREVPIAATQLAAAGRS